MSDKPKKTDPLLKHFDVEFYNEKMLRICKPYLNLAKKIVLETPSGDERTFALKGLLESMGWLKMANK